MPELPEVETVVRTLGPHVAGRRIVAVPHLRPDMLRPAGFDLAAAIVGRSICDVRRRAKRIVFTLCTSERFYVHLGMTGRLIVTAPTTAIEKHTHLIVDLDHGPQLRLVDPRRFGEIVWLGTTDHVGIGPEPLALRPAILLVRLAKTRRAVKAALLDQNVIAGIGNIYADEALHRAGVHPARPANSLSVVEAGRLNRGIKIVLRRAIRAGGSSIRDYINADGGRGYFQQSHRVYDREGEPCRNCRKPVMRVVLGGRSTHFCPNCQPAAVKMGTVTASRAGVRK